MPVYIFDLLGEEHYYIQGLPERWYGYVYSTKVGEVGHKRSIRKKLHSLFYTGKLHHTPNEAQTEQELVKELGFNYLGSSQERHQVPTPEQVDSFIQAITELPNNSWVHFHCSAGKGRTTIAMVMFDIIKNGKNVALEDIVQRHQLLGSENLLDTKVWRNGSYTKEMLENRKRFILAFYQYVNDPEGLGVTSWENWLTSQEAL